MLLFGIAHERLRRGYVGMVSGAHVQIHQGGGEDIPLLSE
jgi:hypothetical protein